jgi:hypothetical protein
MGWSTRRATFAIVFVVSVCWLAATAGMSIATNTTQSTTPYQVVTHDNMKDWKIDVGPGGSVTFDPQPADCAGPPPNGGKGALHLQVTPGDSYARLRNGDYNNTPLASLVALDYWTCDRNNNGQQWPFLRINVDWNGDQQPDDAIFFEPSYQNTVEGGLCGTRSGQATPALKTWQHWDALRGTNGASANACWWSENDPTFMPGDVIRSLSDYIAQHPGATIVNPSGQLGAVQIVHGFSSASDQYDGYADLLRIGDMNPNSTVTYNYEP